MTDLELIREGIVILALTGSIAILALAALRGWNGWLALKRAELEMHASTHGRPASPENPSVGARIEISDLKERIRKLEAIAAGIDL
jgi:hypothetical protein